MRNPSVAISLFVGCLIVVFAAMGWLTWTILRLDRVEEQSRRAAEVEENVRLALWRMDSALVPVLAQENARPYFTYSSYYPAERAYDRMFSELKSGDVLIASPLLRAASAHVLLHFQIDPSGTITSPQVPERKQGKGAVALDTSEFSQRLKQLHDSAVRTALPRALPAQQDFEVAETLPPEQVRGYEPQGQEVAQQDSSSSRNKQRQTEAVQQRMNANEFHKRNIAYQTAQQQASSANNPAHTREQSLLPAKGSARNVKEGMFSPLWVNSNLFLLRRIEIDDQQYTQGCWLDWADLEGWLRSQISDLLPGARLEAMPGSTHAPGEAGRVLAALPVRLIPGILLDADGVVMTPLKISVIVVWVCVFVAALAVALLLHGALVLSERRGAFVSAVTHELRTPLTTFRMYTQMLGDGMVNDPLKQAQYLNVLRVEADRLSHLVENVLAYARLEKGSAGGRAQDLSALELLQRVTERPLERATQAGMELCVDSSGDDGRRMIHADPAAVEQIVFNLVDNACKYAHSEKPLVTITLDFSAPQSVGIRVTDNGPGITESEAHKLFRPFSKSAREAAHSAPGVGLGLALSRRLAREMGGDLAFDTACTSGAQFILTLPTR